MKVIDKLPEVDFEKLVNSPIEYLLDVWEFIVVFYTVVNGSKPCIENWDWKPIAIRKTEDIYDNYDSLMKAHRAVISENKQEIENMQYKLLSKMLNRLSDMGNLYSIKDSIKNSKSTITYKFNNDWHKISKKELNDYFKQYIHLYRNGKIYGKRINYKDYGNSEDIVIRIIQKLQDNYGRCIIVPVPYDTQEEKETRFFEIIAYLYLEGNIKIKEFSVDKESKELFLKIYIERDINSLFGITIDKDKNVFYKGKKVKMRYDSDEFKLLKTLVDFKGRIAKKDFFKLIKWGRDVDGDKNRMNALKNRVLSKLKKCGAKNLKISQAGGLIDLKEGE